MLTKTPLRLLPLVWVVVVVAGCASQGPSAARGKAVEASPSATVHNAVRTGDRVADIALEMVGTPYQFGGDTPRGFDCSGLVYYAYRQVGMDVPRTVRNQKKTATRINRQSLDRGDLLFFNVSWKSGHVGIYIGDDRFVHAPSSGKRVSIGRLDEGYFALRVDRAARLHD